MFEGGDKRGLKDIATEITQFLRKPSRWLPTVAGARSNGSAIRGKLQPPSSAAVCCE